MLEEKIETLTKETIALRQAIQENTALLKGGKAPAKKAAADEDEDDAPAPAKKAPAKKAPAKKKAAEPEHDADEVAAVMKAVAKQSDAMKAKVRKFIGSQDCADLAELLTKPELYDAAWTWADAILNPDDADEDGGDEDEDDEI